MEHPTSTDERIGPIVSLSARMAPPADNRPSHLASSTETTGFDSIKHLLSDKPLHRRGDPAPR